jgi:hypothetical protein
LRGWCSSTPDGNPVRNRPRPRNASPITSATIADSITVNSASTENSRKISSTPKNTPVTGALNVAAIPPPAPQATRIRSRLSGIRTHWPALEARADPICTIGPSRPTGPPVPMHSADATALTRLTCGRIRPPLSATAIITSGTPCPRASRAYR